MKNLRKSVINMFACMILGVAKQASAQFSIIYYQAEIPNKLKKYENLVEKLSTDKHQNKFISVVI